MKSLMIAMVCCLALFGMFAGDADARLPNLFSDEVKFVTKAEYERDISKFAERLEQHGYDVQAAVKEAKVERVEQLAAESAAEKEKESKLGDKVASLGQTLASQLATKIDAKIAAVLPGGVPSIPSDGEQPAQHPAEKPLLYSLIVGALGLAGFAGWKANVAAAVAMKIRDKVAA